MTLRKGQKLIFKDRTEVIIKANNDTIAGTVTTDLREYSTDFIIRWIKFGFVRVERA